MKKILITGGHLTPALALIDELEKEKDIELLFIGRKFTGENVKNLSVESQIVRSRGIKFYYLTTGRLQRRFTKYTIPSLLKIPLGFMQSVYYLLKIKPDLVVSFGGYMSTPVVIAAWLLGIKSVTHEQSTAPGLANKINAHFVKKVFVTWEDSKKYFKNAVVIGNPIRNAVFQKNENKTKIQLFAKNAKRLIYVTGGNQGSHFINNLIFDSLDLLKNYSILHQVGGANFKGDLDKALAIKQSNYLATEFVEDNNLGFILDKASLIISRSGANTVWELAILAKPSILIPLPIAAAKEQFHNAMILKNKGMAKVISQKEATTDVLIEIINEIEKNISSYQKNADNFKKQLPKNSAEILKDNILNLI